MPTTPPQVGRESKTPSPRGSAGLNAGQVISIVIAVLLAIGWLSAQSHSDDSPVAPLTRAPLIGDYVCADTRSDLQGNVDDAIDDAVNGVDDLIAESPELAAYAAGAKAQLRASEPEVRANLGDALAANGC